MVEVFLRELMLPDADNSPAVLFQQAVLHAVALFVTFDLGEPPRVPRCRNLCPGWMSMPEFQPTQRGNRPSGGACSVENTPADILIFLRM